jgi:serine/threonine-protein kinase
VRGTGWTPVSKMDAGAGAGAGGRPGAVPARSPYGGTRSDIGQFVSGAPKRPPDSAGDVSVISPMRVFSDLAVAQETGLLRFELAGQIKEVYLANGSPESVNSSLSSDRFGEYLVAKKVLRASDLDHALGMLPHYAGKLGDTLVGLGLMKPLDVFRLLSQQVRDRVIDIFSWTQGTFAFYRHVVNQQDSFPLGLDTFEILGAGVLNLPFELLEERFASLLDVRPSPTGRMRIAPEAFRLGPTPREVLEMLDGERTLRAWMGHFTAPEELLTFFRALYLLVETDLAQFD